MVLTRILLLALALLLPATWSVAQAADQAINSVCPVTGRPVDPSIQPVIITLGKGERAQRVVIGVADGAAAAKVKANPNAYVQAAKANRKAE
jgi:hypothetical protein